MSLIPLLISSMKSKSKIIYIGDSITFGIGTTGYGTSGTNIVPTGVDLCYPMQSFSALNNSNLDYFKSGNPGSTAKMFNTNGKLASALTQVNQSKYKKTIVPIFFGANDIVAYNDASAILSDIIATHTAFRNLGCKTIAITPMNRKDNGKNVESTRQALKSLILSQGSSFCDFVVDLSAQPLLDDINAPDNSTYFKMNDVDNLSYVHLTDEGARLLSIEINKGIISLI